MNEQLSREAIIKMLSPADVVDDSSDQIIWNQSPKGIYLSLKKD